MSIRHAKYDEKSYYLFHMRMEQKKNHISSRDDEVNNVFRALLQRLTRLYRKVN